MTQTLCDLCGKPIERDGREFKIKECIWLWDYFCWTRLDAHDKCVKMLVQAKREREKDANDKDPEDGTPPLNYRYIFDAERPEEKADKLFETVLRYELNAINKKLEEENA